MSDWHPSRTMISCTNNLLFLRLHVIYLNHWSRSSPFQMFFKISVKFLGKYPCGKLFMKSWGRSATSLKKETLAYVYSCKFCEIFNTCFKKPPVAPSIHPKSLGCCKSSASSSDIFNHSFWSIIWRLGHYFTKWEPSKSYHLRD